MHTASERLDAFSASLEVGQLVVVMKRANLELSVVRTQGENFVVTEPGLTAPPGS